ncbi:hypothetical protein, partial [Desulfitobacterium sp.]|uniref:hypothetical protein n=1 Tax=Desulfitobacterium sp. TaxID=49981 RepID=UPI002B200C8D
MGLGRVASTAAPVTALGEQTNGSNCRMKVGGVRRRNRLAECYAVHGALCTRHVLCRRCLCRRPG